MQLLLVIQSPGVTVNPADGADDPGTLLKKMHILPCNAPGTLDEIHSLFSSDMNTLESTSLE